MKDPKPFTMFVVRLAQAKAADREHHAYSVAADAEALRTIARSLDRIHTQECNGYHDEARATKLEAKATAIAARYGFAVYVQGDPRGLPLYLGYAPHMTDRNYSTTGIGVPL